MSEPLKVIESMIQRSRPAVFEGDAFSVLKSSPYILRAFDISVVDGAIDCSKRYDVKASFADRFWEVDSRQLTSDASHLALIDIKSSVQEDQQYLTALGQRRRVAVYICLCAADPSFVDVIPNFFQDTSTTFDPSADFTEAEKRYVLVTFMRESRIPSKACGGFDQSTSPYRMPLRLLLQAIERIRAHIRGEAVYINPWTGVAFPDWRPSTTRYTECLKPSEKSHRSAYEATMAIYQSVKYHAEPQIATIKPDFVGLQPRLADFKLGQYFVQHKLEGRLRAAASEMTKVRIARFAKGKKTAWYFAAHER